LYATGDYTLRLRAGDGSAESFKDLSFTGYDAAYVAWAAVHWSATGGISDPNAAANADPDGDGYLNLDEFKFGSDPRSLGSVPSALVATPAAHDFGYVGVGTNALTTFTVTNTGASSFSGTATTTGAPFAIVSGGSFTVPAGGSAGVVVSFTPSGAGPVNGRVIFTSTGGSASNDLAGFGATAPVAGFSGSPTNGVPPLLVAFTNLSTGTITNQTWDFGDGATTGALHPAHTYSNLGVFTVALTVFGPLGSNTLIRTNYITVTPPLTLLGAVSRKAHNAAGTFDLPLSLDLLANPTVEPRLRGPTELLFTFNKDVTVADGTLDATEFALTNASYLSAAIVTSNLTLNLTNAVDQSQVTVVLNGLSDLFGNPLAGTNAVRIRALYGDATQSGSVTVSDLQFVKNRLLQPLSSSNFLADLNLSGTITVSDLQVVKNNLLHSVSAPSAPASNPPALPDSSTSFRSPLARLQFNATNYIVSVTATNATIMVTRTGDTNSVVSVGYTTFDGTAVGGVDYGDSSGTLLFAPGDISQRLQVPVLADPWLHSPKTFHLQLVNPSLGAELGAPNVVDVIILNPGQ
jgi:PKD repeat protein